MNLQVSTPRQRAQRRGWDLAEAGLDRGAVVDIAGDGLADGLRHGVVRPVRSAKEVLIGFDVGG